MQKGPIGIFDSGYGGLTVLKEIQEKLPEYDYIYLGDNARAPYGTRSFDVVYTYTLQAVKYLFSQGCHLVILACNTASAKALRNIQQNDLPNLAPDKRVLGVIRPCTESINQFTSSNKVGVFGTTGTVRSNSYVLELEKLHPDITVFQQDCPMWVPLIENNEFNTEGGDFFIQKYVEKLLQQNTDIDAIILGCTHYPIIEKQIQSFLPKNTKLISQGEVVAEKLADYLKRHPEMEDKCLRNSKTIYLTTENRFVFEEKASLFLHKEINAATIHFGN